MNVSYTLPLQHAWARMTRMLFRPFRIEFWLALGFAAFLSEYLSHAAGGGGRFSWHEHAHGPAREAARHVAEFLLHPVWGTLAIVIAVMLVIAALVFLWLSSRGKFMFVDDVMTERAEIVEPWHRYARHGNALFAFWLGMVIVSACLFIMVSLPLLPTILGTLASGGGWQVLGAIAVSWWVAVMIPLLLVVVYVHLFLFHFVVPIMALHDLGVFAAWSRFLGLFRAHALHFIAYGLFMLILMIATGIAVLLAGLATCCVGFLLLWIPYVSSVVLLPVEVTFRGMGPDFLAQFGPEWAFAPPVQPAVAAPPAPPAPPATPPAPGAGA